MKHGTMFNFLLLGLLLFPYLCPSTEALAVPGGEWKIVHLDEQTLALTGDYSRRLGITVEEKKKKLSFLTGWKKDLWKNLLPASVIMEKRPALVRALRDTPKVCIISDSGLPLLVKSSGFWLNPTGLFRERLADDATTTRNAEVAYYLFLKLNRSLCSRETLSITLPTGEVASYQYLPDSHPSALFKWNQVGYSPAAGRKYAYLGAWLGTAGAMPLEQYAGKPFQLFDSNGQVVYKGVLRKRSGKSDDLLFTGEETLELDFSEFRKEGKYCIYVAGIGRSEFFSISSDSVAEAFYIHARGLFHKRCGIKKSAPFTPWHAEACHQEVLRGSFPPYEWQYGAGDPKRNYGFYDASGRSVSVKPFHLIAENAPRNTEKVRAVGGWHDAADYDRRPQHLEIVGDLTAVYLLRPGNFFDGQLNIPESGNGIPDILDEAVWGLKHLLALQQPDGGVGTWIETTRHPRAGDGMPDQDPCVFQVSCATRSGSLEYAAYASMLAVALKQCGAEKESRCFRDSARRAWEFAMGPENRAIKVYSLGKRTIFYREPPDLPAEFLVKAGFNLSWLFSTDAYLAPAVTVLPRIRSSIRKNGWKQSPFLLVELFSLSEGPFADLAQSLRHYVQEEADRMLLQIDENYSYRIPWFGPRETWVHTMAWGTFHPLRRARMLVAAHAITGDEKYLDGAYLANDFHNGANPFGMSMTSGLGRSYPVRFLDLISYADGIAEFVPGLTPYRNTFGIARDDIRLAHGLFLPAVPSMNFFGTKVSLLPREGLSEDECVGALAKNWPIWRRWANVEEFSVAASEYSVWETIGPAAAVTGYLLTRAIVPREEWLRRIPVDDIRKLPGYAPLP